VICLVLLLEVLVVFFFFQAEDGIRDRNVTGVQTCALPISTHRPAVVACANDPHGQSWRARDPVGIWHRSSLCHLHRLDFPWVLRSEERRVGKECRSRWVTSHYITKNLYRKGRRRGSNMTIA